MLRTRSDDYHQDDDDDEHNEEHDDENDDGDVGLWLPQPSGCGFGTVFGLYLPQLSGCGCHSLRAVALVHAAPWLAHGLLVQV